MRNSSEWESLMTIFTNTDVQPKLIRWDFVYYISIYYLLNI